MATVKTSQTAIVHRALRIVGVARKGMPVEAEDYQAGAEALNALVHNLASLQPPLLPWRVDVQTVNLADNTDTYTLNPALVAVEGVRFLGADGSAKPLSPMTEHDLFILRGDPVPPFEPAHYLYRRKPQSAEIVIWPAMTDATGASIEVVGYRPLVDFATPETTADLPNEWVEVLVWGLAKNLALEYRLPAERLAQIDQRFKEAIGFAKEV